MLVTVTLYGWSSFARYSYDNRFTRPSRCFIISLLAMLSIGSQHFLFASAASSLTSKLRSLGFRAILRQDSMLLRRCSLPLSKTSWRPCTLWSHHLCETWNVCCPRRSKWLWKEYCQQKELFLHKALIVYLGAVSEFTGASVLFHAFTLSLHSQQYSRIRNYYCAVPHHYISMPWRQV